MPESPKFDWSSPAGQACVEAAARALCGDSECWPQCRNFPSKRAHTALAAANVVPASVAQELADALDRLLTYTGLHKSTVKPAKAARAALDRWNGESNG